MSGSRSAQRAGAPRPSHRPPRAHREGAVGARYRQPREDRPPAEAPGSGKGRTRPLTRKQGPARSSAQATAKRRLAARSAGGPEVTSTVTRGSDVLTSGGFRPLPPSPPVPRLHHPRSAAHRHRGWGRNRSNKSAGSGAEPGSGVQLGHQHDAIHPRGRRSHSASPARRSLTDGSVSDPGCGEDLPRDRLTVAPIRAHITGRRGSD